MVYSDVYFKYNNVTHNKILFYINNNKKKCAINLFFIEFLYLYIFTTTSLW